jgi:uncharacterized protein (TIGR01777 family)
MRVIITGGSGVIGSELAKNLIGDGNEVIVLSRFPERRQGNSPLGIQFVKWDGSTAEGWGNLADGADVIVNLAGENIGAGRWTNERKRRIIESRKSAGKAVVDAVEKATKKPSLVIQISGVDYYGIHGDKEITENHPVGETFLSETCEAWENATLRVEDYGVRRVVCRSAVVLTLKGGALPRLLLPFRFFVGGPLGRGNQWFSWVHIHDQISALRWFISTPSSSGVYNLCAPDPLQNKMLAKKIGTVMRRPSLIPVPAFVIRLIFGEMAMTVLGGQRVMPQRLEKEGFNFTFPKIEMALIDLLG